MAAILKTFLLLSILLLIPFLSSGRVQQSFESQVGIFPPHIKTESMQFPKPTFLDQGGMKVIMNQRKLLVPVLDYDDAGPNPKHDPRKRPGHP